MTSTELDKRIADVIESTCQFLGVDPNAPQWDLIAAHLASMFALGEIQDKEQKAEIARLKVANRAIGERN